MSAPTAIDARWSGEALMPPAPRPAIRHGCLAAIDRLGDLIEQYAADGQQGTRRFWAVCHEMDRLSRCRLADPTYCRSASVVIADLIAEAA